MVADFLRNKKPEVVKEIGTRLENRAYALIIENGYKNFDRFPALEAAWPGIAPSLPLFLAGDNESLQTVCDALLRFLEFQGRWDECLALWEKAEAKALVAADHENAGWRAFHTGYTHSLRGQADAILVCAGRAAAHWEQANAGPRERAVGIQLLGLGHLLKKNYAAAIGSYQKALKMHRSLKAESADVALGLNSLATAEEQSEDWDAAEEHFREALRVARSVNYFEGETTYTVNLASLASQRKNWPTAEILARQALDLANDLHRQELIAGSNDILAESLLRQGKAAEALPHSLQAVEIFTQLGSPRLASAQATLTECEATLAEEMI